MTATAATPRELDHRSAHGIDVTLLWHPSTNRVTVAVQDEAAGEAFELDVPPERASDAFHHPFAYAASGTARRAIVTARAS